MHGPQELSLTFVMAPEQEGNLIGRGVRLLEWGSPLPRKPTTSRPPSELQNPDRLREPLEALSFPHGAHRTKVTSVRKPTRLGVADGFDRA
jgi:hypothetical protein